jgi:hypothetical protein
VSARICPSGQGRACPHPNHCGVGCYFNEADLTPLAIHNSDGSDPALPVVMFDKPWQWLQDLFYTAVYVGGSICLGVLLLLALVLATGLHRVLF